MKTEQAGGGHKAIPPNPHPHPCSSTMFPAHSILDLGCWGTALATLRLCTSTQPTLCKPSLCAGHCDGC